MSVRNRSACQIDFLAITIRAQPADVWPWLAQLGCRRAGRYSYDALDNGGIPSADRILPELPRVEVGDLCPWAPTAAARIGHKVDEVTCDRSP